MFASANDVPVVSGDTNISMNENHQDIQMSAVAKDRFHGKTIVITGGAGDFGMHCGLRMASEGSNVVLMDIAEEKLKEAKTKVEAVSAGKAKVMTWVCDVTNPEKVKEAFDAVEKEFGDIHYLFNNAGYQGDLT